jgi:DNA mismatch repair ATPase MutS
MTSPTGRATISTRWSPCAASQEAGLSQPRLFVVDEVFRGTTPAERVAAASEVLRYLARTDIVIAATHDLEICDLVSEQFDNAHFEEQVTEVGVNFDYVPRDGPCRSRNAIALLRLCGYPESITDAAWARVLSVTKASLVAPDIDATARPADVPG